MNENAFCNNCGKAGHPFHQCKLPITSIGIIAFRFPPNLTINSSKEPEFLMIRRKDTLGYMDFMRGKFPIYQKNYILNMMTQMTIDEKNRLRQKYREYHNHEMGGTVQNQNTIKEKIHALIVGINHPDGSFYDLAALLDESDHISEHWHEPEWGFPKGRRNMQENDYDCALREFSEETGYATTVLQNIRNILPFEEIFIGSNYKSYRHKYYIMHLPYEASVSSTKSYQKSEVSGMEWKSYAHCLKDIRSYNLEKKRILRNVYECIAANRMVSIPVSNGTSASLADI